DRRRKQQHRPEEAEYQKEDRRPSQRAENPPIAPCALAADCGVCENRRHADERTRDEQHDDRGRGPKGEIPLLEHCRPVLEEKCENRLEPVRHAAFYYLVCVDRIGTRRARSTLPRDARTDEKLTGGNSLETRLGLGLKG